MNSNILKKISNNFLFLFINFLLIVIYIALPNTKISLQLDDIYYKFNDKLPNPNIVFVQIGEKSINKFGRWPWDREVLAKELNKIKNAKVILLDMVFSEHTKKDNYLANVIANKPTVCGFFLRDKATQTITQDEFDVLSDSSIDLKNGKFLGGNFAEINVEPILSNCSLNGVFSTISDRDNLFRRYPIAYIYKNMIFPTLGMQGLRFYFNKDFKLQNHTLILNNEKIPLDKTNSLKLNYYKLKNYNIVPLTDISHYNFTNKIVVVGISEIGVSDIRSTPIGQIPGPLLHYTFISNILNKDYIKQYKAIDYGIIILLIIMFLFIRKIEYISKRITIYLAMFISFLVTAFSLYKFFDIEIDVFYPFVFGIVNLFINEYYLFKSKEKQEKFIKDAFQNYLSPSLLHQLIKNPEQLKLGGTQKEVTMLFTDIRGFTTISENLTPTEIVSILNEIFTRLSKIIMDNEGIIDKYIGDAIMAIFNAPLDIKEHAKKACKSAIYMQKALEKYNLDASHPPINMGIGINTGVVYVGNMGSEMKFNYSAIGDGVNIASRLESETKILKVKILISESTYKELDDNFKCENKGEIFVKGKSKPIKVYSLYGYKDVII